MSIFSEQTVHAKPPMRNGGAIQAWKIPHMLKGMLTWVPALNAWRARRASTGGSDSSRYCYSTWLRHLVMLSRHGFRVKGARVGELGPGDSIGIGLAALLSGADQYVGLDVVPFSARADLKTIFEDLVSLYARSESIPDHEEFPRLRPRLDSYEFPSHLLEFADNSTRPRWIRKELGRLASGSDVIKYHAPWTLINDIAPISLDLIFSQAVLEHVDSLEETYQSMFAWLRPGGYASHVIDFSAHHLSPFWNGHWAYSDMQWTLTRGRREFLLNREPLSTHLDCAQKSGFEVMQIFRNYDDRGLPQFLLAPGFQCLSTEDSRTRGAILVLRKYH